jgi:hypothetical protein
VIQIVIVIVAPLLIGMRRWRLITITVKGVKKQGF